jgi:hypothetical protein
MMLPSAGPMIFTYAEIADTAARKNERIVSRLVLAGGYAAVWLGFTTAAALAQLALTRVAWLDGGMPSASGPFSGALLLAAGLYQFSAFKDACLTQCQRPFPFFFAHWQTTARGVFRLGLQQGLYCLGCCWAMMLLMFATGAMNVLWMAALGMVMTIEKMLPGRRFSHVIGALTLAAGLGFMGAAVAAHWPPPRSRNSLSRAPGGLTAPWRRRARCLPARSSSPPGSTSSPRLKTLVSRNASGRFRSFSRIGKPRRAAWCASACNKAFIVSAAAGR